MSELFLARMDELDAIVARCWRNDVSGDDVLRNTSNRSGRDRAWWSVEIERTRRDGTETRRSRARILLNAPAPGVPSVFEARWLARIWHGVGTDGFRREGGWPLDWKNPSPAELEGAMAALLEEADRAIAAATPSPRPDTAAPA